MKIFKVRRISPKRQTVESYDYFYKPHLRRNETQEFECNTLKLRAREYKRYLEVRQRHIKEREMKFPQNLMENIMNCTGCFKDCRKCENRRYETKTRQQKSFAINFYIQDEKREDRKHETQQRSS